MGKALDLAERARERSPRWIYVALPLTIAAGLATSGLSTPRGSRASVPGCRVWKVVPSPVMPGGILYGVSAVSSNDVWAAGTINGTAPLIEHWNGSGWTVVQEGGVGNELKGISALTASDVWVVGNQGIRPDPLIKHWDGATWSIVPSPSPGQGAYMYSVSALAPDDAWAAGSFTVPDGTSVQPLFLHWDGATWTQVKQPISPFGGIMFSIEVLSHDDVWAVGYQASTQQFELAPLIEHWDGRRWRQAQAVSMEGDGDDVLHSLAVIEGDNIWAVGYQQTLLSMVQHWDGSSWTNVTIENQGLLWGAWGESTSAVWAVGSYLDQNGYSQASSGRWDGTAWRALRTPHPSSQSYLFSVDGTATTDVWAVGDNTDPDSQQATPLTMHSRGPCP